VRAATDSSTSNTVAALDVVPSGSSDSGADVIGDLTGDHSSPAGQAPGYTWAFSSSYPAAAQPSPWLVIGSSPRFEGAASGGQTWLIAFATLSGVVLQGALGQQVCLLMAAGSRRLLRAKQLSKQLSPAAEAAADTEYLSCISS